MCTAPTTWYDAQPDLALPPNPPVSCWEHTAVCQLLATHTQVHWHDYGLALHLDNVSWYACNEQEQSSPTFFMDPTTRSHHTLPLQGRTMCTCVQVTSHMEVYACLHKKHIAPMHPTDVGARCSLSQWNLLPRLLCNRKSNGHVSYRTCSVRQAPGALCGHWIY